MHVCNLGKFISNHGLRCIVVQAIPFHWQIDNTDSCLEQHHWSLLFSYSPPESGHYLERYIYLITGLDVPLLSLPWDCWHSLTSWEAVSARRVEDLVLTFRWVLIVRSLSTELMLFHNRCHVSTKYRLVPVPVAPLPQFLLAGAWHHILSKVVKRTIHILDLQWSSLWCLLAPP